KSKQKIGRALKPTEIQALLASCKTDQDRLIVLAAITTGMRRGELFGLRWEDIDFDNNVINVSQAIFWRYGKYQAKEQDEPQYTFVTPKSATSIREIDLSPKLKQELRKLYDDQSDTKVTADDIVTVPPTGLVFVTEDGSPIEPDRFAKHQFATAVKRAKIGKV